MIDIAISVFPTPVWNSAGLRLAAASTEHVSAEVYVTKYTSLFGILVTARRQRFPLPLRGSLCG